jgi:hypothetical protein
MKTSMRALLLTGTASTLAAAAALALTATASQSPEFRPVASATGQFTHVHTSGFGQSDLGSLQRDAAAFRASADLITMTEVQTAARRDALAGTGFAVVWNPGSSASAENGIAYRTSVFDLVSSESTPVSTLSYARGSGTSRVVPDATTAVLREKATGKTVLVSVLHTPSLVERPNGKGWWMRDANRIAAYKEAMTGWRDAIVAERNAVHPNAVIVAADFNLDYKRAWVRSYLTDTWDNLGAIDTAWTQGSRGSTFTDVKRGRTRHRLIDNTFAAGADLSSQHVIGDVTSSDHNPYAETVTLR